MPSPPSLGRRRGPPREPYMPALLGPRSFLRPTPLFMEHCEQDSQNIEKRKLLFKEKVPRSEPSPQVWAVLSGSISFWLQFPRTSTRILRRNPSTL